MEQLLQNIIKTQLGDMVINELNLQTEKLLSSIKQELQNQNIEAIVNLSYTYSSGLYTCDITIQHDKYQIVLS